MGDQFDHTNLLIKVQSSFPICRVCLKNTLEYVDFEMAVCLIGDKEVTYLDAYRAFTRTAVTLDKNFPSRLCISCADDLCNAYTFSKRVENAEMILSSLRTQFNQKILLLGNEDNKNSEIIPTDIHKEIDTSADVLKSNAAKENLPIDKNLIPFKIKKDSDSESGIDKSIDPDICLQCKDCGKICSSSESYKKHCLPHLLARCKAKTKKSIKCKQCSKTFKFYGDLEKHLLIHAMAKIEISKSGKMVYECNTCKKSYHTVIAFVDHMHIHNGTKPYKCSICGAFRHTRAKLKSHKYHTHGKGLQLRLAIKDEKMKFMKTEPLRFKSKCKYCDKLVVNEIIKRHERMHENPEKRFHCTVCYKQFYTEQNLKFHSDTHLDAREPLICKLCGQKILRKYSMKLHMQRHASEEQKFKCDICETILSAKGSLTEHRQKHFSDNKYKCELCEKTFMRKSRLVYHMRLHTGENPFKCEQCDKSYKMGARLKIHIRVVHGNHTYDCDRCDAKFRSYGGFINHKFVHTGFPFNCPQCKKGTPNRNRLRHHLLQVHKGYMTPEKFDELYPMKSESRRVRVISPNNGVAV